MKKDFLNAMAELEKALTMNADDPVSKIYLKCCKEFMEEPLAADWYGVYVLKTKYY